MKPYDVYAYGLIASSTLLLLRQPFPPADGYAELEQTLAMTGGEALNSAIVMSRLGLRVRLDGNWIGDTIEGSQLLSTIAGFPIDASQLRVAKGGKGAFEVVISDNRSRTIFGNYIDLLSGERKWNIPLKNDIEQARMACIDPPFRDESDLAGELALEAGVPYVTIDCPYTQNLATEAAAVIISGEFREREFPRVDLEELFEAYRQRAKGLVVFTVGAETILYARDRGPVRRFRPYSVNVIDSAGAGDSFRAGVIYGLLKEWGDEEVIRYAAALAAMICERFPGVLNSPAHPEVERFIQVHDHGAPG